MVAAWIFELVRRERDWRAVLRQISSQLSELPDERVRAALDLAAALEHLEPDRRFAIAAYQLAGPGHDRGRSRALAMELGWVPALARLAQREAIAGGGVEPLVIACRALIDLRDLARAQRLLDSAPLERADASDPRLAGIRAELDARHAEWPGWAGQGAELAGAMAADRFVIAARLARGAGRADWTSHLEAALVAEPGNAVATAMLADAAFASKESNAVLDLLRVITTGLAPAPYVDVLRAVATRLALAKAGRAGLSRRLLQAALERAYSQALTSIGGHLAMWELVASAAVADGKRSELLPLVLRGMNANVPVSDRVWLAALGATVCVELGDTKAGGAYAAVVAEHAPSHPVVRELLVDSGAPARDADVRAELDDIELDAAMRMLVSDAAPDDGPEPDLELARWRTPAGPDDAAQPAIVPGSVDPRFIDTRVRALDEDEAPQRAAARADKDKPPFATPPAGNAQDVDDAWEVDEQLFPPRHRPTRPPATAPAAVTATESATATAPASATVTASAAVTPPARPAPSRSLIPSAALRVLQSAGAPRTVPKAVPTTVATPRAPRVTVAVDVQLRHRDREIEAHTRDFSASGFFAVTSVSLAIGEILDCEFRLPAPTGHAEQTFSTRAKVVRRDLAGYALELVDAPPAMVTALRALTT